MRVLTTFVAQSSVVGSCTSCEVFLIPWEDTSYTVQVVRFVSGQEVRLCRLCLPDFKKEVAEILEL